MQIKVKQIDQAELANFVNTTFAGAPFTGSMEDYAAASGYYGVHVVYASGGAQLVLGQKTFAQTIVIPYSGGTGESVARKYVDDITKAATENYSGFVNIFFVPMLGDASISGTKTFVNPVIVAAPTAAGHAVNKAFLDVVSGILQTGINTISVAGVVYTTGNQVVSGTKSFDSSPLVPIPTAPSGAVPKSYVDSLSLTGVVYTTGAQTISGVKTFLNSPIVPIATNPTQAVQLAQLQALGTVMGGVTGFAGVLSLNGSSGASGNLFLNGAGTVTVVQCGPIFTISGALGNNTQMYSAQIPLPNGITGLNYIFGTGFSAKPTITDALEITGGGGGFFDYFVYNVTPTGFSVAFESGIPNTNYVYHFNAVPALSGSGFFGIRGEQGGIGPSPNPRGNWLAGTTYSFLDFVYLPDNSTSYITRQTHISDSFNKPVGTGSALWQIFSSGIEGQTGFSVYQGAYNASTIYRNKYSTTLLGSFYGYTGANPISGVSPDTLTGGWIVIAEKGALGYYINSGIITGNFVNISYYLSPGSFSGLAIAETFVCQNFNFTGFALGCVDSGTAPLNGGILTGSIYVRSLTNEKTNLITNFTFNTGLHSYISGNFGYPITGYYRLGIDITNTLSGLDRFSVGIFGF